ncbi:MAG TPA: hypothetical protein VGO47_03860, partial [Chlamydiales bacterium]|nr:hypothetical protein [Chlamydiales bacterium]
MRIWVHFSPNRISSPNFASAMASLFTPNMSSPNNGSSEKLRIKPWPWETTIALPNVVFEDEDKLQLNQAMYNSQCENTEKLATIQAKIVKAKEDRQKKKEDDEKRALEAKEQKAREDEAAKEKSQEKSASKEKSKEPEKVVEARKDQGKGKEVSTEVEKKKKKTLTKKDGESSKGKKKEIVAEENAAKRATKGRAKQIDVDQMARELEARMEIAPDEQEATVRGTHTSEGPEALRTP